MSRSASVFVSYASGERPRVEVLVRELKAHKIEVWWDVDEIRAGDVILERINQGILKSKVFLAVVGRAGLGDWHRGEIAAALQLALNEGKRVIPIAIPDVSPCDLVKIYPFLAAHSAIELDPLELGENPEAQRQFDRLLVGILGDLPASPSVVSDPTDITGSDDQETGHHDWSDVLTKLGQAANRGRLVYGLGPQPDGPPAPAFDPYEIARELLREVALVGDQDRQWPSLDASALYASIGCGTQRLQELLEQRLLIRVDEDSPHSALAKVIRHQITNKLNLNPLVLTTNVDLKLEEALLLEGLSFTQVVARPLLPRLLVRRYEVEPVKGSEGLVDVRRDGGSAVRLGKADEYDEGLSDVLLTEEPLPLEIEGRACMDLKLDKLTGVVLLKLCGSLGFPGTLAIGVDIHDNLVETWRGLLPDNVVRTIATASLLLLGYCPIFPSYRLLRRTALASAGQVQADRWLVHPGPEDPATDDPLRPEAILWNQLKDSNLAAREKARLLEGRSSDFLDALLTHLVNNPNTRPAEKRNLRRSRKFSR